VTDIAAWKRSVIVIMQYCKMLEHKGLFRSLGPSSTPCSDEGRSTTAADRHHGLQTE
jgi:hypothetical protein